MGQTSNFWCCNVKEISFGRVDFRRRVRMKKYLAKMLMVAIVFAVALCVLVAPNSTAQANMGPKPSINITFKNMGDELCYCTLLFKNDGTGPGVWDGSDEQIEHCGLDREIFLAFANYEDSDGFYFGQRASQCNESKSFTWPPHYAYPPRTFKVLLYYPETKTFVVSGIYELYAFDSNFSVNMKGVDIATTQAQPQLKLKNNYNYFKEIVTLICRVVLNVAVEMGVAWLFRFRGKKVWLCLLITNVATQLILNVILNVVNYYDGLLTLVFVYFFAEFIVWFVESLTYSIALRKLGEPKVPVWKSLLYAFVANVVSFVAGMALALYLPMLF